MTDAATPSVLFHLRQERRQIADGRRPRRQIAGQRVMVHSAGTKPGAAINELSAQALLEVGVDITDETSDANNIGLYCFSSPRRSPVCEET
ncbi:MAG: arsenate-mycothiol transferase [Mycobacterium sp.]|jgi:arsenate-mycothiol transferase|nr:arsenate-mycothiol transferase [Mycobacterium sp.]